MEEEGWGSSVGWCNVVAWTCGGWRIVKMSESSKEILRPREEMLVGSCLTLRRCDLHPRSILNRMVQIFLFFYFWEDASERS